MRKAVLEALVVSVVGLGLGAAVWLLTGCVWLALPACALGTVLPVCWLRSRDDSRLDAADGLADRLAVERDRHEATRQFIQRVLDEVPMPIYVKAADSRVIIINRAQSEQWALDRASLVGAHAYDLLLEPERTHLSREEDIKVLAGELIYKEERALDEGQEQFRVIAKGRCQDTDGNYVIVCARFDTTQWRLAERTMQQVLQREVLLRRHNQDFIQRVLDVIPDPFYIKDQEGRLVTVNEAYARDRGRSRESIIGMLATAVALNPELAGDVAPEDEAVLRGQTINKEQRYIEPRTGEERFRLVSKRPCTDMNGMPLIVVAHINITRWKVAEGKLARMAHEDELTGLPNRRRFLAEAERLISSAIRHGTPLALIIFDLDHFKHINDEHGHVIGDYVLTQVATRLLTQMRGEDLPCRWGGEEFVVMLPLTDFAMALPVAERLRQAFASAPIEVKGLALSLTISGGVAQKRDDETLNECVARADKALYAAKHAGRNRFLPA